MVENLKIGCIVSKDQAMRILTESIDADNVLDEIEFEKWIVEHTQDGETVREEFDSENAALARYNELKTWNEPDVTKNLIGSICDWAIWRGAGENG